YDEMFATLSLQVERQQSSFESLRAALGVIARFGRNNRNPLFRVLADALSGEALAAQFLQANFPRHIQVLAALVVEGQEEGVLRRVPVMQALAFMAAAVGAPIIFATAAM